MILLCEESARSLDWIIVSYYKKVVKKHQHANLTLPKWGSVLSTRLWLLITRSCQVEVEPTITPPSDDQVLLASPSAVVQKFSHAQKNSKWIFFLKKNKVLFVCSHSLVTNPYPATVLSCQFLKWPGSSLGKQCEKLGNFDSAFVPAHNFVSVVTAFTPLNSTYQSSSQSKKRS